MSDDVKAAEERVRRWKAGEPLSLIYPSTKDHGQAVASLEMDWRDLALTHLAAVADRDRLRACLERIRRWRDDQWTDGGDRPPSPPAVLLSIDAALAHDTARKDGE